MSQQTDTPPSRNDATDAAPPALVRKADVGRQEHQARAMTLAKALRLTAAKVADDLLDMALSVVELRTERRVVDDVPALLVPQNLLILLEGPNRQRGAAVLDQSLVEGLIQKLTTGKVQPAPEGAEGRKLTDTDAAICAPFLDALIARAGQLPEAPKDQAVLRGFAFGAPTPHQYRPQGGTQGTCKDIGSRCETTQNHHLRTFNHRQKQNGSEDTCS